VECRQPASCVAVPSPYSPRRAEGEGLMDEVARRGLLALVGALQRRASDPLGQLRRRCMSGRRAGARA
jgi:hypothetical protein